MARTAMILTFLPTLAMPLQFAILVGVGISMLLHVVQTSSRVEVVELLPVEGGLPIERPAPDALPSCAVTLLYATGSLFFAAATAFEKRLPSADDSQQAVVRLILRGESEVGSTFNRVLRR